METDGIFEAADAVLARMESALAEAGRAAFGFAPVVAAVIAGEVRPADGAREIRSLARQEASAYASLPGGMEELVRSLDGAKARYAPANREIQEAPRPRKGLAAAFGWKRRAQASAKDTDGFAADMEAQAAYAGRVGRMEKGAAAIDRAIEAIPALRKETDELIFGIQEMAVTKPVSDPKEIYSVEDVASVLLARSDALGLHARLLSSVDRTGEESHAMALEAHMDSLVESLPG